MLVVLQYLQHVSEKQSDVFCIHLFALGHNILSAQLVNNAPVACDIGSGIFAKDTIQIHWTLADRIGLHSCQCLTVRVFLASSLAYCALARPSTSALRPRIV